MQAVSRRKGCIGFAAALLSRGPFVRMLLKALLTRMLKNESPLSEMIFNPSLILNPHAFLMSLIFADQAVKPQSTITVYHGSTSL
jgi:hypothetical protein